MSNIPMVRRRLPNGDLGPLEPLYPDAQEEMDPNTLVLVQAIIGMQEQIDSLTAMVENQGGGK